jgi:ATP/maltotriose-dependent transcriptional regulator MalT
MGNLVGATPPFGSAHPLVGREREQRLLREALASAIGGRGGLVLLAGEAGIGKTALARDLAREAHARSATVLLGRAYDLSEPSPYGVWLDLLGAVPQSDQPDPVGDMRAALQPEAGQAAGSQAAIFARVLDGFARLARQRPLVCVLDDLHWADHASLDVLRFVARQLAALPLLLVGTYRADELADEHPLAKMLPALVREAEPLRLAVPPLEDEAIRQLVRADYPLAAADAARLLAYLRERTAGNPLYLGELLRTLAEEGLLRPGGGDGWALAELAGLRVPTLLRQLIAERLDRLGADARRWLAVAAVIGQEVPLALWSVVAEVPEDDVLALVERATAARVLDATPDGLRVQFHHPLIRQALHDGLAPPQRRAVHRRVGDLLAASPQPDPDAVADHLQRAGDPRAVEWLVKAGNRARRVLAPRIAAERYDTALALLPDDRDPAARGWLLSYLAAALHTDDPHGGIGHLREALRLATLADDKALAAYARYLLGFFLSGVGDYRQGIPELVAGVADMEALTPEERLRIGNSAHYPGMHLSTLALRLAHVGHFEQARALAVQANARGDEQHASIALAEINAALGHVAEALSWRERAYAAVRREGNWLNVGIFMYLGLQRLIIPYLADRLEQRRHLAAEATAAFTRSQGLRSGETPRLGHLPLLVIEGEWAEARVIALAVEAGGRTYRPAAVSLLADLAFAQGDRALGEALIRKALPTGPAEEPGGVWLLTGLRLQRLAALWATEDGDLVTAHAWLAAHDRWLAWSGATLGLAEGRLAWAAYCRAAGDLAAARDHAAAALVHATEPRQPLALLAAHRLLGELAIRGGRYADAQAHLGESLALIEACAAPYERALTLLTLTELHQATERADEARAALDEARAICGRLGADPVLAHADRLAAGLEHVRPQPAYPDGLTEREVDVLRLVAAGRSNRDAAAALSVSKRTIERHLENLYRKIGAHNRADATAYAFRHHLI